MKKLTLALAIALCVVPSAFAQTARVKSGGAMLYAAANPSSAVITNLRSDAVVEVVRIEGGWIRVREPQGKREGYVRASDVEVQKVKAATVARAPKRPPRPGEWADRGFASLNAAFLGGRSGFSNSFSFPLYQETATVRTEYPLKSGRGYAFGGGIRLWRNLAVAAGVAGFSQTNSGPLTGSAPNPFFYNLQRPFAGTVSGLKHDERLVNVEAAWVIPVGRRTLVTLSAGPAFLTLKQAMVQQVSLAEVYPFDTTSFGATSTETVTKSTTSVGGGVDVAYYFARAIGVGALVRFGGANVSVDGPSEAVSLKVGGLQAGVGLRLRFGGPPAPKRPAPPKKR